MKWFEDMDRRVIEVSEEEEVEVERRVVEYESECEPAVQFAECSTSVQERRILEYTTAGDNVDLLCGFYVEGDDVPHLNNLNGVSGTHLKILGRISVSVRNEKEGWNTRN